MPRYNNIRFQNLVALIDASRSGKCNHDVLQQLDQKRQTTYCSDLFYQSSWPDYIDTYGMTDDFSDMVADYVFDAVEEDVHHQLEKVGGKLSADGTDLPFTPTRDPGLRELLELDRFESGWFRNLRKASLPKELKRAGWHTLPYWLMTADARSNLAYALYAARVPAMERISAFCLGEVFRLEIEAKLIAGMEKARGYNVVFGEVADERDRLPSLYGLLDWLYQKPVIGSVPAFYEWSHGQDRAVLESIQSENMFAIIHAYLTRIEQRDWPDRECMARLATLLFEGEKSGVFVSAMHNTAT